MSGVPSHVAFPGVALSNAWLILPVVCITRFVHFSCLTSSPSPSLASYCLQIDLTHLHIFSLGAWCVNERGGLFEQVLVSGSEVTQDLTAEKYRPPYLSSPYQPTINDPVTPQSLSYGDLLLLTVRFNAEESCPHMHARHTDENAGLFFT